MSKIYFKKIKNTNDLSITYFYFNKKNDSNDELQFLKNKIDSLLKSKIVSNNVKKQLIKLKSIDFNKYNSFYIYSNDLKFAIDDEFVYLFNKQFYSLFTNKIDDSKIKIIKLVKSNDSNDSIDDDELPNSNDSIDDDESNDDESNDDESNDK